MRSCLHEQPYDVRVALHERSEERRHDEGGRLDVEEIHQARLPHVGQAAELPHLDPGVEAPELGEGDGRDVGREVDRHLKLQQRLHHVDVPHRTCPGDGRNSMVVLDQRQGNAGVLDLEVPVEVGQVPDQHSVTAPLLHDKAQLRRLAVDVHVGSYSLEDALEDVNVVPQTGQAGACSQEVLGEEEGRILPQELEARHVAVEDAAQHGHLQLPHVGVQQLLERLLVVLPARQQQGAALDDVLGRWVDGSRRLEEGSQAVEPLALQALEDRALHHRRLAVEGADPLDHRQSNVRPLVLPAALQHSEPRVVALLSRVGVCGRPTPRVHQHPADTAVLRHAGQLEGRVPVGVELVQGELLLLLLLQQHPHRVRVAPARRPGQQGVTAGVAVSEPVGAAEEREEELRCCLLRHAREEAEGRHGDDVISARRGQDVGVGSGIQEEPHACAAAGEHSVHEGSHPELVLEVDNLPDLLAPQVLQAQPQQWLVPLHAGPQDRMPPVLVAPGEVGMAPDQLQHHLQVVRRPGLAPQPACYGQRRLLGLLGRELEVGIGFQV
eukprot:766914-Hanusia_phi.AAC.1